DQDVERPGASFYSGQSLVDIFRVHKERIERVLGLIESTNREFRIDGIDRPLDMDPITQLPAMLLRKPGADGAAGAIAFKSFELIGWNTKILHHVEDFIRIDGKLRKHVL